jgi:K+-transporting ATPase ATPase A chain
MTINAGVQVAIFFILVLLLTKPLGLYLAHVFNQERTWLDPALRPVERGIYWICGIHADQEQGWIAYVVSMLTFSAAGMLLLFAIERLQGFLPLNPQHFGGVSPSLAFNTAASFTTNTNWQNYSGELTMSYATQMVGLAFHNFVSAAMGIALAIAFIRGLTRRSARHLGNFWVDLTRCTLYVLLPICLVLALVLVSQGVIQNFQPYITVHTITGGTQVIPQGPVASQEAIKELGTNGGGFFNANSAHPYENPNALTNLLEMLAIVAIPAALTYTFGRMVGDTRQGWAIFAAMSVMFLVGVFAVIIAEQHGNPLLTHLGVNQQATAYQPGGNMVGKEARFGITDSALFATLTTAVACGAVNSFLDSFTPLGGLVPLVNIGLGEVIFGGVGAGLYGMLIFAILTVFIAGLMVGRTPEYLGKKIEQKEMKMAALAILITPLNVLGFTALALVLPVGVASILNPGPHGLTEVLYAYTSANGNNGSAFAGLTGNTPFYNWTLGLAMLIGRFAFIVPMLAIAGSLVRKQAVPAGPGTFPTNGPLFAVLLIGVVIIVGALTFFPAYALGPVVEHLLLYGGKAF